jgi:hypothetical protein
VAKSLQGNLIKGRPAFGFDLSNATDRFPLDLQKEVMVMLLGVDKTEAWARLIADRPFSYKGEEVRYAVGQPMGFLSS